MRVIVALVSLSLLLAGCALDENILGQAGTGTGPDVGRSFDSPEVMPGDTLTITVSVTGVTTEQFYLLEERPPAGWTITSVNGAPPVSSDDPFAPISVNGNVLRVLVIDGITGTVENTDYVYTVSVPDTATGTGTFSGLYTFTTDGSSLVPIGGSTSVDILICTDSDGDTYNTEGGACGQVDCDDSKFAINPGATESCNNVDDDCDGSVDESLTRTTGCLQEGVCTGSTSTCASGVWGECSILPDVETCNALDDDCDGTADEDGVCIECGNDVLESEEECDDGNLVGGDGCSSTCQDDPICTDAGSDPVVYTDVTHHEVFVYGVQDAARVRFGAWNTLNGQDDLAWYEGMQSGDTWSASVDLSAHGVGDIAVRAYMYADAEPVDGDEVLCGNADFVLRACASTSDLSTAIIGWRQNILLIGDLIQVIHSWRSCT